MKQDIKKCVAGKGEACYCTGACMKQSNVTDMGVFKQQKTDESLRKKAADCIKRHADRLNWED